MKNNMKYSIVLAGGVILLSCLSGCGGISSGRTSYYSSFTAGGENDRYEISGKARLADSAPLAYIEALEETSVKLEGELESISGEVQLVYVMPDNKEEILFDSNSNTAGHEAGSLNGDIRIREGNGYLEFRGKESSMKFELTISGIDRDKITYLSVSKKSEKQAEAQESEAETKRDKHSPAEKKAVFTDEDTEEVILDTALIDDTEMNISAGIKVTNINEEKMEFRGFDLFYKTDAGDEIKVLEYETDEMAIGGYTWKDRFSREVLLPAGTNELFFRNHEGSNYQIELNIRVKED